MAPDLTEQPDSRGVFSGILIALFSAAVAAVFYAVFFMLAYNKQLPEANFRFVDMVLQLSGAIVSVGMTQFLARQVQGGRLGFMQAFLGGWMSCLMLGMLISFFYGIFVKWKGLPALPEGAFAMKLMLFSLLGLIISLILSFIFKKEPAS